MNLRYRRKNIKGGRFMSKIMKFIQSRYGADRLFGYIVIAAVAAAAVNIFVRSSVLQWIVYLLFVLAFARMMLPRNGKLLAAEGKLRAKLRPLGSSISGKISLLKRMWRERKTNSYVKCPGCKKILRLPKQKGVHTVKCPNCSARFQVKI